MTNVRREVREESSCVFLGESENGFVISDHMDSSLPKKKKNRKSKKGSFTMTTACPGAPCDEKNRGKKKQKTDTHGEDN